MARAEKLLLEVQVTAELRRMDTRDHHAAMRIARDAGCTLQMIATAAGVTRQAVWETLRKLQDASQNQEPTKQEEAA